MRVAIVEDQQCDADKLKEYLNKCSEELGVEFEMLFFKNSDIFLQNFKPDFYQAAFLDVYTQSELNGMEVAHKMRKLDKGCQIIFVTTSKEFGVESYEIRAFDYLLKPYEYERLHECIGRLVREMKSVSYYIELKVGRIYRKILLDEVIYTDYNNHYVQLHTEHEVLRSYMPFDELAGMLKPYKQFLNCYRNCFVNMDHIVNLDNKDFVLSSGERMPMFRKEKNELKQVYADYLFNKMKNG